MQAKQLWSLWQEQLQPYAAVFTAPGFTRFVIWVTGLAVNVEEHTLTQSLLALQRPDDWHAAEAFAEYGSWDRDQVARRTGQLVAQTPNACWHGYHVWAGDDTKVHRGSAHVWGTCTYHEYTARCPNRATTVRAHNWVCLGALLPQDGQPACYLPVSGSLYFRASQMPGPGSNGEPAPTFRTKNVQMVALAHQQAAALVGAHLLVVDGAFANRNTIRPLVFPAEGEPRVEVVSRLRVDAHLCDLPPTQRPRGRRGPQPRWGRRLPPPRQGGRWRGGWRDGTAFIYGRLRTVRWKEVLCLWKPLGSDLPIKAVVAKVEGYHERFALLSTDVKLTGLQIVELFCARFRQEDGFRDLKQRLGWEECRAWTQQPIEVTTQALFVVMTLLRLLQGKLTAAEGTAWWFHPPWNVHKTRPSVLDLQRLLRQHAAGIQQGLSDWVATRRNTGSAARGAAVN